MHRSVFNVLVFLVIFQHDHAVAVILDSSFAQFRRSRSGFPERRQNRPEMPLEE